MRDQERIDGNVVRELQRRLLSYEVELRRRSHDLRIVREDYARLVRAVERATPRIEELQAAFASMSSSKFWAIRNAYFGVKRRLSRREEDEVRVRGDVAEDLRVLGELVGDYDRWLARNVPRDADLATMAAASSALRTQPKISIIVPVYDPPESSFREMIESVLAQVYPHWELCLCDDASPSSLPRTIIEQYAALDERIRYVVRAENGHISRASNDALAVATGEFVALLDHDDVLAPHALFRVALVANEVPDVAFVYSDEDKIDEDGRRYDPYFKPDWSPDTMLSKMYTGHLAVFRRSLVEEIGGFRVGFEGSQDYDLVLRFTERVRESQIVHIPDVLYSWRSLATSTASNASVKTYAYDAGERAIREALERRGEGGRVESTDRLGSYWVRYPSDAGRVSVIIPTRDHGRDVDLCLRSLFEKTSYHDFEVILLDNGSKDAESLDVFAAWCGRERDRLRLVRYDAPFNYSRINNVAATYATGRHLLFLNNDTEVVTADWMTAMVEQSNRESIGGVGAKLLYGDRTIQHAGVALGIGGLAGHVYKHFGANDPGPFDVLRTVTNYSVVTAACLMMRRTVFDGIGGFDEEFAVAYNDVDLCMRIRRAGYKIVYVPAATLIHHESKSRGLDVTRRALARDDRERTLFQTRWDVARFTDPYFNPHFARIFENGTIGP